MISPDSPYQSPLAPASDVDNAEAASPGFVPPEPHEFRRQTRIAATVIAIIGLLAYFNSLWGELVFDDVPWIVVNPTIRKLWDLPRVLFPPNDGFASGRPVVNLTIAINYALGESAPGGYHVVNIAIHIAAALALFGVVRRSLLVPRMRERFGAVAAPLALAVAVLWMVHPLQTAAVTYVIQRTEALMGLFFLLTLYCVIRGGDAPSSGPVCRLSLRERAHFRGAKGDIGGDRWYLAAIGSCLLGMATKEVMAAAPLVVLLYDRTFLAGSLWEALRRRWGLYLSMACTWGVIVWCLLSTGFHSGSAGFESGFKWYEYASTQPSVIVHYLRLALWPVGQCLDYTWPKVNWEELSGVDLWLAAAPVALIAVLALLTLWGVVRNSPTGFLGAWFFLILAPTSSIVPIRDAAFEHRMYLPLAAVVALAVIGGYALWDRFAPSPPDEAQPSWQRWRWPIITVVVVAAALSIQTVRRNAMFHSSISVWEDVLATNPDSARAHNNLAAVLLDAGRYDEAIVHCRRALELTPGYADAENNLGHAFNAQGKTDDAIAYFEKALRHNTDHPRALQNLAAARMKKKQTAEAIDLYRRLIKKEPDNLQAHLRLGDCLRETKPAEAIEQYRQALEIAPGNAEAEAAIAVLTARKP